MAGPWPCRSKIADNSNSRSTGTLISVNSLASINDSSSERIDCLSAFSLLIGTGLAILPSLFCELARACEICRRGASRRPWQELSVARLSHHLAVFHNRAASHENMRYPSLQSHSLIRAPSGRRQESCRLHGRSFSRIEDNYVSVIAG